MFINLYCLFNNLIFASIQPLIIDFFNCIGKEVSIACVYDSKQEASFDISFCVNIKLQIWQIASNLINWFDLFVHQQQWAEDNLERESSLFEIAANTSSCHSECLKETQESSFLEKGGTFNLFDYFDLWFAYLKRSVLCAALLLMLYVSLSFWLSHFES